MNRYHVEEKRLKEMFKEEMSINSQKKAESLMALRQAVSQKNSGFQMKMGDVLRSQFRFLDYKILILQVLGLIIAAALFRLLSENNGAQEEFLAISAIMAVLLGVFVPLSCSREYAAGITELAESCYFNIRQSCILKMAVYGGIDLLVLLILSMLLMGKVQKNLWELGIYFLVPFLISCCIYFGALMMEPVRKSSYLLAGTAGLTCAAAGMLTAFPQIYERGAFAVWISILPLVMLLLLAEVRCFFEKIEEGEILCMN